jgi:hypothetical protein
VVLAGAASSIVNSIGTKIFFGNDVQTAAARFFGDVTGMEVSILLLMLVFRAMRQLRGIRPPQKPLF